MDIWSSRDGGRKIYPFNLDSKITGRVEPDSEMARRSLAIMGHVFNHVILFAGPRYTSAYRVHWERRDFELPYSSEELRWFKQEFYG